VEQLKTVTSQYLDLTIAENKGRIDVSGYGPNMGHHYLNLGLADGLFELEKPRSILYLRQSFCFFTDRFVVTPIEYLAHNLDCFSYHSIDCE
jgi:hypothetical protein